MIKSTLIQYLKQQIKQAKEDWNPNDSYCIEITPDQANLIIRELDNESNEVSKSEHTPYYDAECITCDYRTRVKCGNKAICGKCDTPMIISN